MIENPDSAEMAGDQIVSTLGRRGRFAGQSTPQLALKRLIDVISALLFLAAFGWLYLLLWVAVIVTARGSAIFEHERVGRGGSVFKCLKFRSMVRGSDLILKNHLESNVDARAEWEREFKLKNDPRVTKLGRFMRKTSLDEIPQFFNVLRGDMSLVGPRPVTALELSKYYKEKSSDYTSVRPGITGLWQIGGRSDVSYQTRVELDSLYARTWSVWGDIWIVLKTVHVVVAGKGSY